MYCIASTASKSVVKVRVTWLGLFLVIGLLVVTTIFLIAGTNKLTTGQGDCILIWRACIF